MTSPTSKVVGSGIISRNNDDPTAKAIFTFMVLAGIACRRVVLWNVIPGWNGTLKISAAERRAGFENLAELLKLLPNLKAVVLVGGQAGRAAKQMRAMNLRVFTFAHPSARVRNRYRPMWDRIPCSGQRPAASNRLLIAQQTYRPGPIPPDTGRH
ncbi:uracil-DNA glycosylase [Pseudomonas akapageensis]|uniref:uracil-DNA glycosylase n=1 Tax=Pseudomonas akapageensis TaxID=2609961 RepID=UPI00140CE76D|nr:uracil-DNA glycosylase [Pseudomonas akapageensis]